MNPAKLAIEWLRVTNPKPALVKVTVDGKQVAFIEIDEFNRIADELNKPRKIGGL